MTAFAHGWSNCDVKVEGGREKGMAGGGAERERREGEVGREGQGERKGEVKV